MDGNEERREGEGGRGEDKKGRGRGRQGWEDTGWKVGGGERITVGDL